MNEQVLSIDFGSSFTKVCLRGATRGEVDLLPLKEGQLSTVVLVPSTAVIENTPAGREYLFGANAYGRKPDENATIPLNWKRLLFEMTPPVEPPQPMGWDALLSSAEFRSLAARYQLTVNDAEHLRSLARQAQQFAGIPPLAPITTITTSANPSPYDLVTLTNKFFQWLLGLVKAAIEAEPKWGIRRPSGILVRVTVPAFALETQLAQLPGCQVIRQAIEAAGWRMVSVRPFVSEPLANAFGIMTHGNNHDHNNRPYLPEMLKKSPLRPVMAQQSSANPLLVYRIFVVDIGAYTTDCALICYDPQPETEDLTVSQRMKRYGESDPVGTFKLERDLFDAIDPEDGLVTGEQSRLFQDRRFRELLNSPTRSASDRLRRQRCMEVVRAFAEQVTAVVSRSFRSFLASEGTPPRTSKKREIRCDLAVTGGGSYIPMVAEAIRTVFAEQGIKFINTYISQQLQATPAGGAVPTSDGSSHTHFLEEKLIRGGTAIGGASIIFG